MEKKKGLKETVPKDLPENTRFKREDRLIRANNKSKKVIRTEVLEKPKKENKEQYKNNFEYNLYAGVTIPFLGNYLLRLRDKFPLQLLIYFSGILVATVFSAIVGSITSSIVACIFFILFAVLTFTGLNENFVINERGKSLLLEDTETTKELKLLKMKLLLMVVSLLFYIPIILIFLLLFNLI